VFIIGVATDAEFVLPLDIKTQNRQNFCPLSTVKGSFGGHWHRDGSRESWSKANGMVFCNFS
jgi:hypothetical protein